MPSTGETGNRDRQPSVDRSASSLVRPMLARLWTRSGMSWIELIFCLGLLVAVAAVVYTPHVRNGGFYSDDWANASDYRYQGWSFAVTLWHDVLPGRPALAALLPAPYALFGNDPEAHLTMAVGLGIATSLCFYVFLRELSMEPIHAGIISILSLLFPWSEAARLWPTASLNNVAVCAYLLGTTLALRGLRLSGRRAIVVHGAALVLYLLSLLVYEVAGFAIALSIILYRTRASFRHAALPWLGDVALVVGVLGVSALFTSRVRHVGSLADRITDIPPFTTQGVSIFASTFLPPGFESSASKGAVVLVVASLIGCALWASRDPSRTNVRRWLRIFGIATVGIAAAYFMFLGSFFLPVHEGIGTRMHTLAGLAFVVLCYATIVIGVELLTQRPWPSALLVVGASLLLALGFTSRLRADIGRWDAATVAQHEFLVAIKKTMPRPTNGSTIFSFGYPGSVSPGIPIFTHDWDLNGALRLTFDDPSISGRPIYEPGTVICARTSVYPTDLGVEYGSPYRRAVFVDVTRIRAVRIDSRQSCLSHLEQFVPGPAQR